VSAEGDHLWETTQAIAHIAKGMMPSGVAVIDVILLSAYGYCVQDLKMTRKEAFDLMDVRLCTLFEKLVKESKS
jgi:hypothetical protein